MKKGRVLINIDKFCKSHDLDVAKTKAAIITLGLDNYTAKNHRSYYVYSDLIDKLKEKEQLLLTLKK